MSLLDKGRQVVTIYHPYQYTSPDGNIMWAIDPGNPDYTETVNDAAMQPTASSGTSARRKEQSNEGYETEDMYRFRLPRRYKNILHPSTQIDWQGRRYHVVGHPYRYDSSPMTSHVEYTVRRN